MKSGKFSKEFSDILTSASMVRNESDYSDFYIATKEEAHQQVENAQIFMNSVEEYLSKLEHELQNG